MQKVCHSEDGGLNEALKLARRIENDGVVASAALELSGSCGRPGVVNFSNRHRSALEAWIDVSTAGILKHSKILLFKLEE